MSLNLTFRSTADLTCSVINVEVEQPVASINEAYTDATVEYMNKQKTFATKFILSFDVRSSFYSFAGCPNFALCQLIPKLRAGAPMTVSPCEAT
jgi:hypothetical protein